MIHFTKIYLKNHKGLFIVSTIMLLFIFYMIFQLVSVYSMKAEYAALQKYDQCIQFIPNHDVFIAAEYDNIEEEMRAEKQIYTNFIDQLKKNTLIKDIYYGYRSLAGMQETENDSLFLCNSKNSPAIKASDLKLGNGFSDNEGEVILVSGKAKLYDTINIENNGDTKPFKVVGMLKNSVLAIDTGELIDFSTYNRNVYLLNPAFYDKQENYEDGFTVLYLTLLDNAAIDDIRELEHWGELQEIQIPEYRISLHKILILILLAIAELIMSYMFSRYKRDYMWKVIYSKPTLVQASFILLKNTVPVVIGFVFIFIIQLVYSNHHFDYKVFWTTALLYIIIRLVVENILFLRSKNSYLTELRNRDLIHYNCAYKTMLVKDWLEYIVWEVVDTPEQYVNDMLFDLQMEKYANIPLCKMERVILLKLECYLLRALKNIVCDAEYLSQYHITAEDCIQISNFMDRTI